MHSKSVLIIIPAFDEARAVSGLIHEVREHAPDCDILVVDDGSRDTTTEEAARAGASVVRLPFNLGIGGAVQTGYKIARDHHYDIAVQLDGDAQHDPRYLKQLILPVAEDRADLCIGSRFLEGHKGFQSTFARRVGIRFFCILLTRLTGILLTDPTSGFRAVGRSLIESFAEYYPVDFPEPEAIQIARRRKARILEIPVTMRERAGGVSSIRFLRTAYYMIKVTFAILIDTLKKKN